ncbi:hypothetical protein SB861_30675, partial [Paraburkholderia sp. SIMBA_049]
DKAEKSFAIHYIADLRPADGDTRRTYSFLLESLNRRTIVCRRFDDDVSPIMFDLRIAIQVGANLARA